MSFQLFKTEGPMGSDVIVLIINQHNKIGTRIRIRRTTHSVQAMRSIVFSPSFSSLLVAEFGYEFAREVWNDVSSLES